MRKLLSQQKRKANAKVEMMLPGAPKMLQPPCLEEVPSKLLILLVDLAGIEPATSSMPWKRAPSCATGPSALISILIEVEPSVNLG
jgi:hypothetical protein